MSERRRITKQENRIFRQIIDFSGRNREVIVCMAFLYTRNAEWFRGNNRDKDSLRQAVYEETELVLPRDVIGDNLWCTPLGIEVVGRLKDNHLGLLDLVEREKSGT